MCWASGVLLYGQFITSSSLRFASEAHVELKPQLKAVKLIQHRLRTGKLIVKDQETQKTVRDFTAEIWTRISSVLVSSALEGAEQALVGEYRCEGCKIVLNLDEGPRDASWADKNAERKGEVWKLGWAEPSCEYCLDTLVEKDPFEKPKFTLVQDLLEVYGLCMPYDEVWKQDAESYHDFESLSAVALPLISKRPLPPSTNPNARRGQYPAIQSEVIHDYGSSSHVINIDPRIFSMPSAATDQKFDALVKRWHLQVRSRTDTTILPNAPKQDNEPEQVDSEKGKSKKKKKLKVKKLKPMSEKEKLRPHWMVWSLCEPCD